MAAHNFHMAIVLHMDTFIVGIEKREKKKNTMIITTLLDLNETEEHEDMPIIKFGMSYDFNQQEFSYHIGKFFLTDWEQTTGLEWRETASEYFPFEVVVDQEIWFEDEVKRLEATGIRSLEDATCEFQGEEFRIII